MTAPDLLSREEVSRWTAPHLKELPRRLAITAIHYMDALAEAERKLAAVRDAIPKSLMYEVPDVAQAVKVTFAEYVKTACENTANRTRAEALQRRVEELTEALAALVVDAEHKWGDPHTLRHARTALQPQEPTP